MTRATIVAIILIATLGFAANSFAAEPNAERQAYVPKQSPSLLDLTGGDVADAQDDEPVRGDGVGVGGGGVGAVGSGGSGRSQSSANGASGLRTQFVSGYVRSNGIVVQSYVRSSRR